MTVPARSFDDKARSGFARVGKTTVHRGELLRHPVYTRFIHWSVAIFFVLSLLSGFAIYSPWLYPWLTPLFGGGARTRALHPWFGLLFDFFFLFQFVNWFAPMSWTRTDTKFLKNIKGYATNEHDIAPAQTGFFNGGQKSYFWIIAITAVLFLITGLILWFDDSVSRVLVAISYVLHDVAALIMLAGFIIHIYEGTAHQPGTFRSMIDGTVTEKWAWTHHPAWYGAVTDRDPAEAYEREKRRQSERQDVIESLDREEDARERPAQIRTP